MTLSPARHRRRAFSLVEATLSMLIIGGLMVATLSALGAAAMTQRIGAERVRGAMLAQDLLSEILLQPYEDPDRPGEFGPSDDAVTAGDRTLFNSVCAYHGWSASPPQLRSGATISGLEGWRRSVVVERLHPNDLRTVVGSDTGIKRITVLVERDGKPVARLITLRTAAWQPPPYPEASP